MKVNTLSLPSIEILADKIYESKAKSGSRYEYSLALNDDLIELGHRITTTPLKFASLVLAVPGEKSQDFHADSDNGERAIIYIDDVLSEDNGPIEFLNHGPVFGKSGTCVHYAANEIHRGTKSKTQRYALALAFSDVDETIDTVGAALCDFKCPLLQSLHARELLQV